MFSIIFVLKSRRFRRSDKVSRRSLKSRYWFYIATRPRAKVGSRIVRNALDSDAEKNFRIKRNGSGKKYLLDDAAGVVACQRQGGS